MDQSISALIASLAHQPTQAAFDRLLDAISAATFGLELSGLASNAEPGRVVDAAGARLRYVATPDGRRMLRACADPEEFASRFTNIEIAAHVTGAELVRLALRLPDCEGVLVCSARTSQSVPIDLLALQRLAEA